MLKYTILVFRLFCSANYYSLASGGYAMLLSIILLIASFTQGSPLYLELTSIGALILYSSHSQNQSEHELGLTLHLTGFNFSLNM